MDKPRIMSDERKAALRRMFQRDKVNYIHSLVPLTTKTFREVRREESLAGYNKYDELKKNGELPLEFRVLENIADDSREALRVDVKSDPVYNFLLNVRQRLYDIAGSQYERRADLSEADSSQDIEVYVRNKENFLDGLIGSLAKRSFSGSSCDWSSAAKVNTESRYNYLAQLASLEGKARNRAIRGLVKSFPDHWWDNFYWPNEHAVIPVSCVVVATEILSGEEFPF
jgi:hypothetical protein